MHSDTYIYLNFLNISKLILIILECFKIKKKIVAKIKFIYLKIGNYII